MRPKLTFFCELETPQLGELFKNKSIIPLLQKMNAGISLGTLDFSEERARVAKRLNQAGIPITAWILLPKEHGYWSNINNFSQTKSRYALLKEWTVTHQIQWSAIGIDLEPDYRIVKPAFSSPSTILKAGFRQLINIPRFVKVQRAYVELIDKVKSDGFRLETYQFPWVIDERLAKSRLVQRFLGIPNLQSEREIYMLYSSMIPAYGPGLLWSYAKDTRCIAIGSTGGGVELAKPLPVLSWSELERDLRFAWRWTDDLYIFSLEGCIEQDYLEKLANLEWDQIILEPIQQAKKVDHWRISFQLLLWFLSYIPFIFILGLVITYIIYSLTRKRN